MSFSQFCESNTSRPAAFLSEVVATLLTLVRQQPHLHDAIPADLVVLDGTFLRLASARADWLPTPGRSEPSGVMAQVVYRPATDVPERAHVCGPRTHDTLGRAAVLGATAAELAGWRGETIVQDLGYYDHGRFATFRTAGVHVVSRLRANVRVTVEAERAVQLPLPFADGELPPARITVHQDARVTIGSPNNRKNGPVAGMRLVVAVVAPTGKAAKRGDGPRTYQIVTDRFDLSAEAVVAYYLARWQIELFFRWLKHHVQLLHLLGTSRNAIALTV